jgi:protein-S-isoprenylcysteine O-methyltransferase Ste14
VKTLFIAIRALLVMSGFVYIWYWLARLVQRLDEPLGTALGGWAAAIGIPLVAAGGALALYCAGVFVFRGRGTPAPFDAPREFVAVGPYRYVRNPMYIGGFLVLAGFGLAIRSGAVVLFSAIWFALFQFFVIYVEEPGLRARFGDAYERYCRTVPRWIPRTRGS